MPTIPLGSASRPGDVRAVHLLDQLEEMTVLNGDVPTRLQFDPDMDPTFSDIVFESPDLSLKNDWRVIELLSNHLPILVSLKFSCSNQSRPKHTFLNYRKADWASFPSVPHDHCIGESFKVRLLAPPRKEGRGKTNAKGFSS